MNKPKTLKEALEQGWTVSNSTKTGMGRFVILHKKRWNWSVFVLLTLIFPIIGTVAYIVYYASSKGTRIVLKDQK